MSVIRASFGERKIADILEMNGIHFQEEYIFPGLRASTSNKPLRFDFAVFDDDGDVDYLIEFQGKQHYEPNSKFGGKQGFFRQQHNDNKKRRFCNLNGYKLIEIRYDEVDLITFDYIVSQAGY